VTVPMAHLESNRMRIHYESRGGREPLALVRRSWVNASRRRLNVLCSNRNIHPHTDRGIR
jgi:hypothetical protein